MTSLPLTSNNVTWTTPSCVAASSSALLWAGDSNAHDSGKQLFCHSSNPLIYISRPISAKAFSIDSAPASTTSPRLQVFTSLLPAACCTGRTIPSVQDFIPGSVLPRGRDTSLKSPVSFYQNTALKCTVSFIATSWVVVFIATSVVSVCFITSLWCSLLLLRARAAIWYHKPQSWLDALVARLLLGGASPCSIEFTLATWCHSNKYITCILPYHCVKVRQFSDTSLKINNLSDSCGAAVLTRAHVVLDHSERFPLTGLESLSASLLATWEGPAGWSIGAARCSSLTHSWLETLPEVALSLLKELKWLHYLSGLWTTLACAKSRLITATGKSVAWPHNPMHAV